MNVYLKNLNRIEFVVTMACTGKCIHCSEGDHSSYTGHIDADVAANAIREICRNYKIKSLMTFGGEALLYPEVVIKIHKTATEMEIPQRDLITNGFFSEDRKRIKEVVEQLADSGICRIFLSVDSFHQETIPIEPVKYFAGCVVESGILITLSPAWLIHEDNNNIYNVQTRKIINEFAHMKVSVGPGNVIFPSGNAVKYLVKYFDEYTNYSSPYEESPRDIRTISFSPNGDVLNGNIYKNGILDIIKEYKP